MQNIALWLFTILLGLQMSCTASESTDEAATAEDEQPSVGSLQLETINKVIAITEPVVAYPVNDTSAGAAAAISFNQLNIGSGLMLTATTGVSLGDSTSTIKTKFTQANGSKAFCETVNNAMKFFKEASQADMNLCILKKATAGLTVRNGDFQTWDFTGNSSYGTFTYRMKFALETEDSGSLKRFESFTCMAMGSGQLSQTGYALQTVTDGKLAIHALVDSDEGLAPVKIRTDVEGALNADGRPIGLKTIDYAESQDGRFVHTKVTQSEENIQAISFENSSGRLIQTISFVEFLDKNAATGQYAITKLAYGDGAALTRTTDTGGSVTNNTSSWDGDTLLLDTNEPRRAKVADRTSEFLTTKEADLDVNFSTAETYDCSGTADETITLSESDVAACMDAFDIDQNGSTMCNGLSY